MQAKETVCSFIGILGLALTLFLSPRAYGADQEPKEMTLELQKVRKALDKYQDPIMAVHDG